MSIKMWDGNDWIDGSVKISAGGTTLRDGTVQLWPWIGGADLVGELEGLMVYGGHRGFGGGEWPNNTLYAASQLFSGSELALVRDRMVGVVDLRILTGTASVNKLVLSYESTVTYSGGTGTVSAMTEANWATATIPSPAGGAAQAATFWDNSTYPEKSVAPTWIGKQVLVPIIRDANTVAQLVSWVNAHPGSWQQIIAVSDTFSHCTTMQSTATPTMNVMQRFSTASPTTLEITTAAANNFYGLLVSSAYLSSAVISACKANDIKIWVYSADTPALVQSYSDMGVDGILATTPVAAFTNAAPPPPINVGKTVWGYAATSSGDIASAGTASPSLVKPKIARVYCNGDINGNGSVNWNENLFGLNQPALWSSCKPSLSRMNNPDSLAADTVAYFKAKVPKGQYIFHTFWHEPEGGSDAGGGTIAEKQARWHAIHDALYDEFVAARAQGHKFFTAPIICDWVCKQSAGSSKGTLDTWYPTTWQKYDVQGYDVYPQGKNASGANDICRVAMTSDNVVKPYADATRYDCYDFIIRIAAHAKKCGKPWGSGETGIIRQDLSGADVLYNCTLQQRGQRHQDIVNHVSSLSNPPWIWTWYDDGGCTIHGNDPGGYSAAVWNATINNSGTLTA